MTTTQGNSSPYIWRESISDPANWAITFLLFSTLGIFWAYRRPSHAALFAVGFALNEITNHLLKRTIKAPRPNEDIRLFQLEVASGRPIDTERYGMPSHHAQIAFYITVFLSLTFKSVSLLIVSGFVSLYVCYMRVKERKHSVLQVFVGAAVGGSMAALVYYGGWSWINKKREGGIREDGFLLSKNYSFG